MALIEVKVPQLSESVAEATLLSWHKKPGEAVARDENLIDIETDKVVLELPAPDAGVLAQVLKHDGDTVVAGEIIAMIDTEAKASTTSAAAPAAAQSQAVQSVAASSAPNAAKQGVAMPAAAKLMAEQQLSASDITGTGRDGRITKGDVLAADRTKSSASSAVTQTASAGVAGQQAAAKMAAPSLPIVPAPADLQSLIAGRPEQRVPMSRLRARVAERLLQSQSNNAILTTFNEVNMQPVMDLR